MKARDEAFKFYFYFIQERMTIFWKRFEGESTVFTNDPILANHKFTNVYRVLDRVSQFLIREVIYVDNTAFDERDILFRILLFKVFNNIGTWQYLENEIGTIKVSKYDVAKMSALLGERIQHMPIFNGAYMMAGSHQKYNLYQSKHLRWMKMVEQEMIKERRLEKIIKADSLQDVYTILSECSFIGNFLAYQYAIDFNYSGVINFDENSFVKAGIGAVRGIKKCFVSGFNSYEDCIRFTHENLSSFQQEYGFTAFKNLFGRDPTLIDLQNCFCETDKYLRVKMPELDLGNVRIKQKFVSPKPGIDFFFPPKWNLDSTS